MQALIGPATTPELMSAVTATGAYGVRVPIGTSGKAFRSALDADRTSVTNAAFTRARTREWVHGTSRAHVLQWLVPVPPASARRGKATRLAWSLRPRARSRKSRVLFSRN